ncbi:MAG: hypothetical protein A2W99_10955 [Bacteroidetes bacterium GWF2_33_16]|nr:MAG: hypothetical protein A2X00_04785 [Bacteroidetes bacterium GWE2_32_14]OFY04057.1 MAG: hypothetical protein A2W99_10955 [Bacteroidetes bacterium GWF2_33_16]
MKKLFISLLVFGIAFTQSYSQKQTKIKIQEKTALQSLQQEKITSLDRFIIKESISDIIVIERLTKEGVFGEITADGMSKTYSSGNPDLPLFGKLIEIPANQTVKLAVINYKEKQIQLANYSITEKIIPAQESMSKSDDPEKIPFKINKDIYSRNRFYKNEFITFEDRGYLRDKHLGFIQISPFEYNPVTNTLLVKYDFEIEVQFVPDNKSNIKIDDRLKSSYFENLPIQTINEISDTKALIQGPVKYVIVSDPMFETTLQPFIEWKKLKGFDVISAYTNNPLVGNTATTIKAYLKDLYDNPSNGISPTFVLLVGDVAQVPASYVSSHSSDLYYYEYTGDKLPEVFGGRFSATTIEQLQPQIDKTLQVEKYLMPDPSYLNNVVIIAGADASYAPTYGNGFVNYTNTYYTNSANGINSISYLYPTSASADETIRTNISNGVALANYTAHCSSSGWSDPTFSIDNVASMTNANKYPLMIGNCCESLSFGGNCFGEELLRAANKGAVGYIGASNLSYWDEDFYWAIGVAPISANPTYEGSGLGAYDRFFHLNNEAKNDWFITQGQINVAGNLAVEASSSTRKAYYWEIYHLMGDPSLTPFVKVPTILSSSYNNEIIVGSPNYEVITEEDAFVALSFNGVLLDAKMAGSDGLVVLSFSALPEVGIANLVITKQNRIPVIEEISIIPSTTPYIIKDLVNAIDITGNNNGILEYGENISLNVQLKNVSTIYDAFAVVAKLQTSDSVITPIDSIENYGTILKDTVSLIENAYQFVLKNTIQDQHLLQFNFQITGSDASSNPYIWNSKASYLINAPNLIIGNLIIDDSGFNANGIVDPGETVTLKWIVQNTGHADISGLTGLLEYVSGSTLVTINQNTTNEFILIAGETDTLELTITVSALENKETPVELKFSLVDNQFDFYTKSKTETIIIGEIPEHNISDGGRISIYDSALFYDSGGSINDYKNDENYTITFVPYEKVGLLKVKFISFDVEQKSTGGCWDKLTIYDDTITNVEKIIGEFCSYNPPSEYIATNSAGALTFKFYSDESVVKPGWKAEITRIDLFSVKFIVTTAGIPVENALVKFNSQEKYTNAIGEVIFDEVNGGSQLPYEIRKTGYNNVFGNIDVTSNITKEISLVEGVVYYTIDFTVTNGTNPISGATILFDNMEGQTDTSGKYSFDSIAYELNKKFTVSKEKYLPYIDSIDVDTNYSIHVVLVLETYTVTFQVTSNANSGPLEGVNISFNTQEQITNTNGVAIFIQVEPKSGINYTLTKSGFVDLLGNVDIVSENKILNLTMSIISSINDIIQESISIYPNPSQGLINIDMGLIKNGLALIDVFDILGKSIFRKEVMVSENTKEIIDLTEQPKGIYFISVKTSSGEQFSRKIIIK